uniref:Uncharacterized protein LOC111103178 n=1 Tax=Crassostrea virginica TaxID=6565 RepID=A0A8B8AMU1_CRAVI|nr:uncharacterized protein LOC111103178 [Crassostrea virginica]
MYPKLVEFMEHCCVSRKYFFTVRKYGASDCQICDPPRLPVDVFSQLHNSPDPVPGDGEHKREFSEVFGTETTEEYCPSFSAKHFQQSRKQLLPTVMEYSSVPLLRQQKQ